MRKGKDPVTDSDPYLWLMDPDPGGPKICGSGSPTLFFSSFFPIFLPGWDHTCRQEQLWLWPPVRPPARGCHPYPQPRPGSNPYLVKKQQLCGEWNARPFGSVTNRKFGGKRTRDPMKKYPSHWNEKRTLGFSLTTLFRTRLERKIEKKVN